MPMVKMATDYNANDMAVKRFAKVKLK